MLIELGLKNNFHW